MGIGAAGRSPGNARPAARRLLPSSEKNAGGPRLPQSGGAPRGRPLRAARGAAPEGSPGLAPPLPTRLFSMCDPIVAEQGHFSFSRRPKKYKRKQQLNSRERKLGGTLEDVRSSGTDNVALLCSLVSRSF